MAKEKVLAEATAVFLLRDGKVLLARKTRHIGENRLNGYGGEIRDGETERASAARELEEESSATVALADLEKVADIEFINYLDDGSTFTCRVRFFFAYRWAGEPQ